MSKDEATDLIQIFLNAPLYRKFDYEISEDIYYFDGTLDMFCPECNQVSVFKRVGNSPRPSLAAMPAFSTGGASSVYAKPQRFSRIYSVDFECSRNKDHTATFLFLQDLKSLRKIGEYPSLADRQFQELAKYEKELDVFYQEFKTAHYLYLHNVAIGSFVYLRRVLEKVVVDVAIQKYSSQPNWNLEKWRGNKGRFENIIEELADDLPEFLVKNTVLYKILSKGVHELAEDECIEYFEVVKAAIEEILDEKMSRDEKERRRKSISGKLTQIHSDLNRSK